jgi:hypothetical protein
MLACEVRVAHRGPEVGVPHGLLHVDWVLALGEPRSDPPVPEVVQMPARREPSTARGCPYAIAERSDAITGLVVTARAIVMEYPGAVGR